MRLSFAKRGRADISGIKMTDFFTADSHFGHKNVMKLCNRPWDSIEEHDEALIERHNYYTWSYDEIAEIMKDRSYAAMDHHT